MATRVAGLQADLSLETAAFESGAQRARRAMQQTLGGIERDVGKASSSLSVLATGVQSLAAGFGIGFGTAAITSFGSAIVKAGDQTEQLRAKLTQAIGAGAFEQAQASAQKLGVSVDTVAGTMARLGNALKSVGVSGIELQQMTETLAQMGTIAGSTGAEIESALTQFSQGLAKGRLDGDELRGVLEAMPPLAQALADELGVTVGELRDLGAEGKITGDVMRQALLGAAEETAAGFDKLPVSLSRATAQMQNSFMALFAAIDKAWGSSAFVKFIMGGAGEVSAALTARLNLPDVTPRVAAYQQLAEAQERLARLEKAPVQGLATGIAIAENKKLIAQYTAEVDKLGEALEKTRQSELASLRQRAEAKSLADPSRGISPQAIYPSEDAVKSYEYRKGLLDEIAKAEKKAGDEAERTAKKAASEADQRAKSLSALKQELTAAEQLAAVAGDGAYAQELVSIELERQQALHENLLKFAGQELAIANKTVEARAAARRREAAIKIPVPTQLSATHRQAEEESWKQWQEDKFDIEQDRIKRQQQADKAAADAQREILIAPWEELAVDISRVMSGVFNDILTDAGNLDFSNAAEGFADTFATAISGSLSNIITGPLQTAVSKLAETALDPSKGFLAGLKGIAATQTGGALLSGGAGFIGGSLLAQMTGGNARYGGLGGGIGAGAGFLAGSATGIPYGGVFGAALGGIGGGLLGGLFGSEQNLGNDRSAQVFNARRGLVYSDVSFSQENRQVTQGIISDLESLSDALSDLGATFEKFNLRIEAGNKSGITVNGKKYANAQDALRASVEELVGRTAGLTQTQQTILSRTRGGTGQEILKDIGFGEAYDQLIAQGSDVQRALADLAKTFESAGKQAAELGLDVGALEAAHKREAAAILAEFQARQQALQVQLEATAPAAGADAINAQFRALELQFQELGRSALELEVPFELVTAAHQRAADALAQSIQQQQRALLVQLRTTAPVAVGEAPRLQLDVVTAQFEQLNIQFEELGRSAANLNIPLTEVTAAHERAAQQLSINIEQQQRQIAGQIAAAAGDRSLATQLFIMETQFRELGAAAEAAGMPDAWQRAHHAHLAAIRELMAARAQETRRIHETIAGLAGDETLATRLHILDTQFNDIARSGTDLGISIGHINTEWRRAREKVSFEFAQEGRRLNETLASLAGDQTLTTQLHALETQFNELRKQAANLNIPLSHVNAQYGRAVDRIKAADQQLRQSFRTEVAGISPAGSEFQLELQRLDQRMAELRQRAIELGESLGQVNDAAARARAELIARNEREKASLIREVENIAPTGNILARELDEINDRFFELRERAKDLGVSIDLLNAAQLRAREEARARYEQEQINLRQELETIAPTGSSLQLALKEVDNRFVDLRKRAIEFGVALSLVDAAYARAREEVQREYQNRRTELLSQVENLGAMGLAKALNDIRDQFRDLRKELDAVGLSTVDLTQKQKEAERRAVAEFQNRADELARTAIGQQRGIRDFFEGLIEPLRAANQNVLAPIGRVEGARTRFRETAALARGGDVEAIRDLASRSQELLALREQFLSSGGLGAEILREVTAATQGVIGNLEAQQREAMASVPDVIRETTAEHIRVLIEENKKTLAELAAIKREIAQNRLKAA